MGSFASEGVRGRDISYQEWWGGNLSFETPIRILGILKKYSPWWGLGCVCVGGGGGQMCFSSHQKG